jgi:hypothetical protein
VLWWKDLKEKGHVEGLDVDGRIILKWNFKKMNKGRRLDRSGLGQGQVEDCCECSVEPPSSIKCREFLY